MIGGWEILLVLLLFLILFGGKRLPDFARNLGKGIREFKKASREMTSDLDSDQPPVLKPHDEDTTD